MKRKNGDSRQHNPDIPSARVAILLAPNFCESNPPNIQDNPPEAMTKNENNGIFRDELSCV